MKRLVYCFLLVSISFLSYGQEMSLPTHTLSINWISFEDAISRSNADGKPVFIDVYATWCGPCKWMDKYTFHDSSVVAYVNSHFHAVKFDAETRDTIYYQDTAYFASPIPEGKTKSPHYLAAKLLNGNLLYPTIVFITPNSTIVAPVPGRQTVETIQPLLFYFGEQTYLLKNLWESYMRGYNAPKFTP